jgi:PKD repeat protein
MKFLLFILSCFFSAGVVCQTWQDVGGGTNSSSHGMCVWNGLLVNGGSFNSPCGRVATWDGTSWSCLAGGVGIVARASIEWNGNLVVVGDFWNNFQPCTDCNGIAVWDGTTWSPLGTGFNNDVLCLAIWNGDLVAGGDFTEADGQPCSRVARWDGTTWQPIGGPADFDNDIRCMVEYDGEFWVGGDFNNAGGCAACDGLTKWNGTNWVGGDSGVDITGGVDSTVRVLYVNPNDGNLYMGGHFTDLSIDGVTTAFNGVAMYDGSEWTPLGTGVNSYVRMIHEYNGNLIVGGDFNTASGVAANKIAKWNPLTSTWSAMGTGMNGYVKAGTVYNGTLYAGGDFTTASGLTREFIASWYEVPSTPPVANINSSSTAACSGGCITFSDFSTNSPTSWSWDFPGSSTPVSTAQNPGSICYSSPGTYTVTLEACNGSGCDISTVDVTITATPTISFPNQIICAGQPATLTATPSAGGGTYLWSPGGSTTQTITVSPASTTNYQVTYTLNGCSSAAYTGTVTVKPVPDLVDPLDQVICAGSGTTAVGFVCSPPIPGTTYSWTNSQPSIGLAAVGASSSIPGFTAINTTSGTVISTVTVTPTANGCVGAPEIFGYTVYPTPTVSFTNQTICAGQPATLTATPSIAGGTYLWSPGGQTTQAITVSPASTANYQVTYTLNGCPSPAYSGTVTVNPVPGLSVTPGSTICSGTPVTLVATPTIAGGNFSWTPGASTSSSITVSPTSNTTYTVSYTLNGCAAPDASSAIVVNTTPTVSVPDETICVGNSVTLTATPSSGGGTYSWSPGGETTPAITVSPASPTTYSVTYTLNGCTSPADVSTVDVIAEPIIAVNDPEICSGDDAYLLASAVPAGGTYLWSPGGATTEDITVTPGSSETYTVTYTVAGCNDVTGVGEITVNEIPSVTVNDGDICEGETITLTAVPSDAGGTFEWSGGETTVSIDVSPTSPDSYTVTYTLNGCTSAAAISTVNVNPAPDLGVTQAGFTLSANQAGATYQWINCSTMNNIPGETGQAFTPSADGQYAVTVDLNGCIGTSGCSTISGLGGGANDILEFTAYPSPFDDIIRITIPESETGQTLAVYDMSGKLVHIAVCGQSTFDMNLVHLDPGVYSFELQTKSGLPVILKVVRL